MWRVRDGGHPFAVNAEAAVIPGAWVEYIDTSTYREIKDAVFASGDTLIACWHRSSTGVMTWFLQGPLSPVVQPPR